MTQSQVILLKLGGSLITDKSRPHTPRPEIIRQLAEEIAEARRSNPNLRLILGHGSGSFGHTPAKKYATRQGVSTPEQWQGFHQVWQAAAALNQLVMRALEQANVSAMVFPPSASVLCQNQKILQWDIRPIQNALSAGLLPVVYGDVVFDTVLGGTILSTEDEFAYMAPIVGARRILLAGIEPGVWADYPHCTHVLPEISKSSLKQIVGTLQGSAVTDVTGGMASKVHQMLDLIAQQPTIEGLIFSAEKPGRLIQAIAGRASGTRICAQIGQE